MVEIDEHINVLGAWETLLRPGIPITEGAQRIHGISDADVMRDEVPTIRGALHEIGGFQPLGPICLICHNVRFDRQFLAPHLEIEAELCTLELARKHLPNAPNHKLGTLRTFLNLAPQQEHAAMGDIMLVVDLLRALVPLTGRTLMQLIQQAAKPSMLYVMPFGQYKGKPITSIPVDYRNWLLDQSISPDLRYTLNELAKAFI